MSRLVRTWALMLRIGRRTYRLGGPHGWDYEEELSCPDRYGAGMWVERYS